MKTVKWAILALILSAPNLAWAEPLAVVVSKQVKLDSLSMAQLRQVFLGEPSKHGGVKLLPLNLPGQSPERSQFDQVVLGMDPKQVARFWVDQRIRGKAKPPKTIPSASTLVRLVAKVPGAIGYVPVSEVGDQVQIVRIDGKAPSDADYPLQ